MIIKKLNIKIHHGISFKFKIISQILIAIIGIIISYFSEMKN